MRITVPYRMNEVDAFIEADVLYDVIATAGPPLETDFGVTLQGFRFVELWRFDESAPGGLVSLDPGDSYDNPETGGVKSPYDKAIEAFIRSNEDDIIKACLDLELT